MNENRELDEKLDRLRRVAHAAHVGGILLATHHNIAWITGGRSHRVDASRETGTARLLVTADGRRFVLANAIEMPRLLDETLAGLGYESVEYPWIEDQADPSRAVAAARRVLANDAKIGADWALPDVLPLESAITRARALLTDAEAERYRRLGRDTGLVVGHVCRALTPGDEEREIARTLAGALAGVHARAIVTLVGSDDRLRHYRHPIATTARWRHVVMMAVCAERDGLVVSLSRIVAAGAVPPDLHTRTRATAAVFGRLLTETRPGVAASRLYDVASEAYRAAGFPGEEQRHHQGGATGYRSREWVAHPASQEIVQARQAFAWNPSIAGTKVEDTALVTGDEVEVITSTPDWPAIPLPSRGRQLEASDVWRLS